MSDVLTVSLGTAGLADDSAKRRQIIEGAREVFLTQGVDAASMNDIARKAGVSKGTLYVYFKNKEDLFEAITEEQCRMQAEGVFMLDPADHDVAAVLPRGGAVAGGAVSSSPLLSPPPSPPRPPPGCRVRGARAGAPPPVLRDRP